jgi:pilus assembly protein Flp/PilA
MLREQKGQGLVEYALIIVLVAIAVVVAITALGTQISAVFNRITQSLSRTG